MGIQKSIQLLSQKVIDEYNRNGVVRLKGVLTDSEVNALRDDVDNQIARRRFSETAYDFEDLQKQQWSGADEFDGGNSDRFNLEMYKLVLDTDPEARPILDKVNDEESGMFFYDAGQWRFYEGIKKCAIDSALPHISAKLMDSSFVNFWEDTTFVKSPNTSQRTTFHQDWSYFQIKGEKCCIVWIPLDPVTEENGGMEYIRGSHLWGKTYAPNLLIAQSIDPMSPYEKLEDIESNIHKHDVIRFDVEPGDVIIHHVMTVHGSSGNKSKEKMRRAIAFRYCGDDITYFDKPGALEQPFVTHKLENGDRLHSDDYPLVYGRMPIQ